MENLCLYIITLSILTIAISLIRIATKENKIISYELKIENKGKKKCK